MSNEDEVKSLNSLKSDPEIENLIRKRKKDNKESPASEIQRLKPFSSHIILAALGMK